MDRDEVQQRTQEFALRVIRLVEAMPRSTAGFELGRQVLRSATSAGAKYRAARPARSRKEFLAKLGVVIEEADESAYWLELIANSQIVAADRLEDLKAEANALTRLFAKSRRTARMSGEAELTTDARSPDHQTAKSQSSDTALPSNRTRTEITQ